MTICTILSLTFVGCSSQKSLTISNPNADFKKTNLLSVENDSIKGILSYLKPAGDCSYVTLIDVQRKCTDKYLIRITMCDSVNQMYRLLAFEYNFAKHFTGVFDYQGTKCFVFGNKTNPLFKVVEETNLSDYYAQKIDRVQKSNWKKEFEKRKNFEKELIHSNVVPIREDGFAILYFTYMKGNIVYKERTSANMMPYTRKEKLKYKRFIAKLEKQQVHNP